MEEAEQKFYVSEVQTQWEHAQRAADRIDEWLKDEGNRSPRVLFGEIHTLLTHAGNISKLFWPMLKTRGKNETDEQYAQRQPASVRGEQMRQLFNIQPGHSFEKRPLRDHLEHFDERIDNFWLDWKAVNNQRAADGKPQAGYADLLVAPQWFVDKVDINQHGFIIRHFDQETSIFTFRGIPYDIKEIYAEVQAIGAISLTLLPGE